MTTRPLIYRNGSRVILLDVEREVRVGTYHNEFQALRAWACYLAQGRCGTGFDYEGYDEYVTDEWRKDSQQFLARCEVRR